MFVVDTNLPNPNLAYSNLPRSRLIRVRILYSGSCNDRYIV